MFINATLSRGSKLSSLKKSRSLFYRVMHVLCFQYESCIVAAVSDTVTAASAAVNVYCDDDNNTVPVLSC